MKDHWIGWLFFFSVLGCALTVFSIWLNHRRRIHNGSTASTEQEFDKVNRDAKSNQDATQASLAQNRRADSHEHEGIREHLSSNQDALMPIVHRTFENITTIKTTITRWFSFGKDPAVPYKDTTAANEDAATKPKPDADAPRN